MKLNKRFTFLLHTVLLSQTVLAWPPVGRAGFIMDNLLAEGNAETMI